MTLEAPRRGQWQQTFTGRAFWPLDARAEEIDVRDIAHALACQNRFAGHTRIPYSVGEHSVRCARYVRDRFRARYPHASLEHERQAVFAALLHDATEAYLVDLPRPVKVEMPDYRHAEARLAGVVEAWAGLPRGALEWAIVREADEALLATEKRDLLGPSQRPWGRLPTPLPEVIEPWNWQRAEAEFIELYGALCASLGAGPSHYHGCPSCYEKAPCALDCTILEREDGVGLGGFSVCAGCKASGAGAEAGADL